MRSVSLLSLLASAVALSACAGGGGEFSAADLSSTGSTCINNDPRPACNPVVEPPPVEPDDPDDPDDPDNPDTGTGSENEGNDTRLSTGDRTIIIEKSKVKNDKDAPGLSVLTEDSTGRMQIAIDTKQDDDANAKWPQAKYMREFVYGSTNPGIDNDLATFTPANLGAAEYKEYRALTYNDTGTSQDEVLQVWNFNHSYVAQYRNLTDGGEAGMQSWSYGGTKTAAGDMPTGGTVNYNGRWGATAKTWNWAADSSFRTVDVNNHWRITGSATGTADFGAGTFNATLTPTIWNAFASLNGATGFTSIDAANLADPNWYGYMDDQIALSGSITNGTAGNEITGSAEMNPAQGWVTNEDVNPFYAAFFGPGAAEVSGVFALEAVAPSPTGGNIPINDDRRGFLYMSGAVNLQ